MGKLGFYFDSSICIGCRTCQVACKDKNRLDVGVNYRKVHSFETGIYPSSKIYHYSSACNHCADAKCVKGCPTGAMHYGDDGTVQHDKELCIGCQYCIWNCPYNVPQYIEKENVVGKCDSCIDLRDKGQNPACVDSCLMRCLEFGDLDVLKKKFGPDLVNEIPILPPANIANPSLLIKPKNCALESNYRKMEV